jgi:hypothetical protein
VLDAKSVACTILLNRETRRLMATKPAADAQAFSEQPPVETSAGTTNSSKHEEAKAVGPDGRKKGHRIQTHDPRQVIEDLRNHLAAHDRRLAFLFGAGTSSSINIAPIPPAGEKRKYIPLIAGAVGLTTCCKDAVEALGENHSQAWTKLCDQCKPVGRTANVEDLLSNVRNKIDAVVDGDTLVGLNRCQLEALEAKICSSIASAVIPNDKLIPRRTPHDNFAAWVRKVHRTAPLEIFTTNYDILLERAFENARVPVFDGFVGAHEPFFYPECLEDDDLLPKPKWIRLWKLHGSVNWKSTGEAPHKRIIRGAPSATGEMILPSHRKYDESRKQPYMAYIDRLSRAARSEHSLLIVCGYSFGDQHINEILYGALDNRNTSSVIALQFDQLSEADPLVEAARNRANLSVIGPNAGIISRTWGIWQLTQPVDKKTHAFMDTAFDSNALPEDGGSPAATTVDLQGKMRLVNFDYFCRFLDEMGSSVQ